MAEPNQKPAEKKPAEKKPGVFARLKKYFRDTKSEVKKVAWPTKQQTINLSLIHISQEGILPHWKKNASQKKKRTNA